MPPGSSPAPVGIRCARCDTNLGIGMDATALRALCNAHRQLSYAIMKRILLILAQQLDASLLQFLDVYGRANVTAARCH